MNINFRVLIKILGVLALIEGLFLLPCAAVGIVFKEWGRNLAIIVETAAVNHRQKQMGYNAAEELYRRVQESLAK